MSLALNGSIQEMHLASHGQNSRIMQWGSFAWNGTDTTGELPVRMRRIESIVLTRIGAPNTNEKDYLNETEVGGGVAVPDSGTLTIDRNGTPTSGAKVMFQIIGE